MLLSPVVRGKKGRHEKVFEQAKKSGFVRVRCDGSIYDLNEIFELDKNLRHTIEIVIDRLVIKDDIRSRLNDSVETALRESGGTLTVVTVPREGDGEEIGFSTNYACEEQPYQRSSAFRHRE